MKCPLCNSGKAGPFCTIARDSYLHSKVNYCRCLNCELLFVHPQNLPKLKELYKQAYRKKISLLRKFFWKLPFSAHHRQTLLFLANVLKQPGKALDVGSSEGKLLYLLKLRGWAVKGIEPTRHYAEFAKKHMGFDVFEGFVDDFKTKEKFDLIILCNVLEHLPNPEKSLRNLARNLNQNGHFYIALPAIRRSAFSSTHLFLFNRHSLGRLMQKLGLEPARYSANGKYQRLLARRV